MSTTIRAAHYGETERRLMEDPIVQGMAAGLLRESRNALAHESGGPRHEFMGAANARYRELGGTDGGHLGAVASALIALLDEEPVRIAFEVKDGNNPSMGEVLSISEHRRCEIQPGVRMRGGAGPREWRVLTAPVEHPGVAEARGLGVDLGDGPQLHVVYCELV